MVSAIISSLRGAFGQQARHALTQADILAILEKSRSDLERIWFQIDVLEEGAPATEGVVSEVKGLRRQSRRLMHCCQSQIRIHDKTGTTFALILQSHRSAQALDKSVNTLDQDVMTTSKRIHGLSSTLDVSVVNENVDDTRDFQQRKKPARRSGVSEFFKFMKWTHDRQKQSRPDSSKSIPAASTSRQDSTSSGVSGPSQSPWTELDSLSTGRPAARRENTVYRFEFGYETATERVVFSDRQVELADPGWIEPTLDAMPEGQAFESRLPSALERVGRHMSLENCDAISLESEYFDTASVLAPQD